MTQPIAGPCDSPKFVTVNKRPRVLPAIERQPEVQREALSVPHQGPPRTPHSKTPGSTGRLRISRQPGSQQRLAFLAGFLFVHRPIADVGLEHAVLEVLPIHHGLGHVVDEITPISVRLVITGM